jgi:hypothetical protein
VEIAFAFSWYCLCYFWILPSLYILILQKLIEYEANKISICRPLMHSFMSRWIQIFVLLYEPYLEIYRLQYRRCKEKIMKKSICEVCIQKKLLFSDVVYDLIGKLNFISFCWMLGWFVVDFRFGWSVNVLNQVGFTD